MMKSVKFSFLAIMSVTCLTGSMSCVQDDVFTSETPRKVNGITKAKVLEIAKDEGLLSITLSETADFSSEEMTEELVRRIIRSMAEAQNRDKGFNVNEICQRNIRMSPRRRKSREQEYVPLPPDAVIDTTITTGFTTTYQKKGGGTIQVSVGLSFHIFRNENSASVDLEASIDNLDFLDNTDFYASASSNATTVSGDTQTYWFTVYWTAMVRGLIRDNGSFSIWGDFDRSSGSFSWYDNGITSL